MSKRLENTKYNIFSGIIGQFIKIGTKFSIRTVIIYYFGAAYLGLDGLFMNVISMLSLAEMGIGDAVCFALYKPLADKDEESISAYMRFYKMVYQVIGVVVLCAGLILIPFLEHIVNLDKALDINYKWMYVLFLFNSVLSYWFGAYRQVLLIADQKMYEINKVNMCQMIIQSVLQIMALILLNNYYIYIIIMLLSNLVKNIYLFFKIGRLYPVVSSKSRIFLSKKNQKSLAKNVYALLITKISTTVYTSSDNLVISAFVGTIIVGYYSNYSYIVSAVTGFISIIFSSVTAGIGNVNANSDPKTLHNVFKKMLLVNHWIYGLCFVCLWQLLTPFVRLWTGNSAYVLADLQIILIVLMFLIPGLNHTCTVFRAACGLFWQTRYRTIVTALINVIVSIVLARHIGLSGVFIGTILAYLLTTFVVDPKVLYREIFHLPCIEFYVWFFQSLLSTIIVAVFCRGLCLLITLEGFGGILYQLIICLIVYNGTFYLLYHNDTRFQYFWIIMKKGIKRNV